MAKRTYVWDGSAWVEAAPIATFNAATTSTQGIVQLTDSTSSTSTTTAATPNSVKSAYDFAGTKIAKSGDTFTGALSGPQLTLTGGDATTATDTASLNLSGYNQRGGTGYHGFLDVDNTYGSATNPKKFFRLNSTGALQIINNAYSATIFEVTDAGNLTIPGLLTGSVSSGNSGIHRGVVLTKNTSTSLASITLSGATYSNTTKVSWTSATKADTGMWSSGSAITAPLAGLYMVTFASAMSAGTGYAGGVFFWKNTSTLVAQFEQQAAANTGKDCLVLTAYIYLAANDTISISAAASTTSKILDVAMSDTIASMIYLGAW